MPRILFVAPYPQFRAPSQRFRFEQYYDALRREGADTVFASFWTDQFWPDIYKKGNLLPKVYATVAGFTRRFLLLFTLRRVDTVFIHREATPLAWPWWEWAVKHIWKKKIIFDFDDAIWLSNNSLSNAKLIGKMKMHGKTAKIISWADTVFAGNQFLANYASRFCPNVHVVPTSIDTVNLHNKTKQHRDKELPVIGWTGTHSTLKQLMPMMPVLEKLRSEIGFKFLLVADFEPENLPHFVEFREWNKATEIDDLLEMDIGIMPLYNTDWERGKCGFKALQYMALSIPAVISAVGVNTDIVVHGDTGYLCSAIPPVDGDDWEAAIKTLVSDWKLRQTMGDKARKFVEEKYSVNSNKGKYMSILNV